jgi:hypothetical protein
MELRGTGCKNVRCMNYLCKMSRAHFCTSDVALPSVPLILTEKENEATQKV